MRLKATKTKLHALLQSYYPDVPALKNTEFVKAHGSRSYWLRWYTGEAYLSACAGAVRLILPNDQVVTVPVVVLDKMGMIERTDKNNAL